MVTHGKQPPQCGGCVVTDGQYAQQRGGLGYALAAYGVQNKRRRNEGSSLLGQRGGGHQCSGNRPPQRVARQECPAQHVVAGGRESGPRAEQSERGGPEA